MTKLDKPCGKMLLVAAVLNCMVMVNGCEHDGGLSTEVGDNDVNVVVALGDSITEGYKATPYPAILDGLIHKTVINAGKGGDQTSGGASRVGGLLARHSPGYLLIMLGSNDAIHGVAVDSSIASLRSIVVQTKANGTIPVLATIPPMTNNHAAFAPNVDALNTRIRQLSGEEGVALADVAAYFGDGTGYLTDEGLHPNDAGQRAIALAFADLF